MSEKFTKLTLIKEVAIFCGASVVKCLSGVACDMLNILQGIAESNGEAADELAAWTGEAVLN
ncbi:hypothetical protein [Caproicibacterium amylolyticum]|uniref:Uncharacterized protein n=1 Tax=Caproicibacterium amylolyticum TaxID=2766537 RepID=A0A7G9WKD6_9FIRM|nr:hypothetical protein [Caproicibacterium amylolyticum]QNO19148.1 hypothetical protein H6X83_05965 [Caproicibacterium amylolyticum]